MAHFSIAVSNATRVTYVIDTHGAHAAHILALTGLVQGFVSYGATFFANGLVLSAGVRRTLVVVAGVQAACLVACVPVYVFGKRVRAFVSTSMRSRLCRICELTSRLCRSRAILVSSAVERSRRVLPVATPINLNRPGGPASLRR